MKAAAEEPEPQQKIQKKATDNFEIRIPRFSFKNTSLNVFLVFVLIIFAFLLGMLTNKVIYLEQQMSITPTPVAQQPDTPPTPPLVVSDMTAGKLPILGNKDAKVTVVEFSDFQCPFCKQYFDDAHKQLKTAYIDTGKIAFAYRHYPLNSIHPLAQKAGEAAECANEQDKFWEYHDLLFKNQDVWSQITDTQEVLNSFTYGMAEQLGLNTDQFLTCLESDKYKKAVDDDTAAGNAAQVNGTPTFFINGVRVVGAVPFSALQKVIEEELKK